MPLMPLLQHHAQRFCWQLTPQQLEAFQVYYDELAAWNQRANLTAIVQPEAVEIKHFLDSLTCLLAFPEGRGLRVIDVGSGAGFPGLPVRIVRPDLRLALLESVGKKTDFLCHIVARLRLSEVAVLQGRAEDYGRSPEHRECYDVVLARSVAELRVLAELTLPFCHVGGVVIAQKRAGEEETTDAAQAIAVLGGACRASIPVDLPDVEPRQLVVIDKLRATPAAYPRRAGIPQKRPL
jgi:16S rRNA (guanine527-N7)-methyltransferase